MNPDEQIEQSNTSSVHAETAQQERSVEHVNTNQEEHINGMSLTYLFDRFTFEAHRCREFSLLQI